MSNHIQINKWQNVMGLEIHVQLDTSYKLFSSTFYMKKVLHNINNSIIDIAIPGTLPAINKECLELVIKLGFILRCKISYNFNFDRKNYFYQDLPQGYQISQFFNPILINGYINIEDKFCNIKKIYISHIHLEQDAGKSIHDVKNNIIFVDLNRSGIPLIEIVTKPNFCNSNEIENFINKLKSIFKIINICDGCLENGSIRCDINISIKRKKDKILGTKVEIKNLNSFYNIKHAINYEIIRQINILQKKEDIIQETRSYNNNKTISIRRKENISNYCYFPDPNFPFFQLSRSLIKIIKNKTSKLLIKRKKNIIDYMKTINNKSRIMTNKNIYNLLKQLIKNCQFRMIDNWICCEFFIRKGKYTSYYDVLYSMQKYFITLLTILNKGIIFNNKINIVLILMIITNKNPKKILNIFNSKVNGRHSKEYYINRIIKNNKNNIRKYQHGKTKLLFFFIGQILKYTKQRFHPNIIKRIFNKKTIEVNQC